MTVEGKMLFVSVLIVVTLGLTGLSLWRWSDTRADRRTWSALAATQPASPGRFYQEMVANQPDPAQRYFQFTITPGTPLYTVAEIEMTGQFSLGAKEAPNYMAMTARQV